MIPWREIIPRCDSLSVCLWVITSSTRGIHVSCNAQEAKQMSQKWIWMCSKCLFCLFSCWFSFCFLAVEILPMSSNACDQILIAMHALWTVWWHKRKHRSVFSQCFIKQSAPWLPAFYPLQTAFRWNFVQNRTITSRTLCFIGSFAPLLPAVASVCLNAGFYFSANKHVFTDCTQQNHNSYIMWLKFSNGDQQEVQLHIREEEWAASEHLKDTNLSYLWLIGFDGQTHRPLQIYIKTFALVLKLRDFFWNRFPAAAIESWTAQ